MQSGLSVGQVIQRSVLIYGITGSGKSTQAGEISKYAFERGLGRTRLIASDGGGITPYARLINRGIVEYVKVGQAEGALFLLRKLSKGHWVNANGELVPGDFDGIGCYIIDSLTATAQIILSYVVTGAYRLGKNEVLGFGEQDENFIAPQGDYYQFTYSEISYLTRNFLSLPVPLVVFTALEAKGVDGTTGIKIPTLGPAVGGPKINAEFPTRVGDLLRLEVKTNNGKKEVVVHWEEHEDSFSGLQWPAKTRIPWDALEEMRAQFPSGQVVLSPRCSLKHFLEIQDQFLV